MLLSEALSRFAIFQIFHKCFFKNWINTYIYIFPHNLFKMQVFNLVFDSQILP